MSIRLQPRLLVGGTLLMVGCAPAPDRAPSETTPQTPDTEFVPSDVYAQSDVLFGLDRVHTVDLVIDQAAIAALEKAPQSYVPAAVTIDGESLPQVGLRLKGSSVQSLDGKAAFKVDVDHYQAGATFHGLRKLTFNNMLDDSAQVHELLAWSVVRAVGLPHSRVGYAWITVNGEPYGLYAHVETPDGDWMERTLGSTTGRVYEGGYPYYPESYAHADFDEGDSHNFDLEVGESDDYAELDVATDAIAGPDDATWDDQVSRYLDLDQYALFQVTEAWVGQWDGYAFAVDSNNYRIWVDVGGDERIRFVPSGLDWAFTDYAESWSRSRSPVGRPCQQSDVCRQRFATAAAHLTQVVDPDTLVALHAEAWSLILPFVEEDPRRITDLDSITAEQAIVDRWITDRTDEIIAWYGD